MRARHHRFLILHIMHNQCAHSVTRAYFGVRGALAENAYQQSGSIRPSGPFCDAFLRRLEGEKKKDPAS
jgi:hypothetical protein